MAKTIVIASGKGGVGKSTTAACLGSALSDMGMKTLLVDCDAGLNSLDLLLQPETAPVYHWLDVFNDDCGFETAAVEIRPNLKLLTAPDAVPANTPVDCLREILAPVEKAFDFILLDAPAGLGTGLSRAVAPANSALILATADEVSVKGANKTDVILRQYGIAETRLILNRYQLRNAKKGRFLSIDEAIDKTCVQLIGVVPEDKEMVALSVTHTLSQRSKSRAAFTRIARRIRGEHVLLTLSLLK